MPLDKKVCKNGKLDMPKSKKDMVLSFLQVAVFRAVLLTAGIFLWMYGTLLIAFHSVLQEALVILWAIFLLGMLLGLDSCINRKRKRLKYALFLVLGSLLTSGGMELHYYWTTARFEQLNDTIHFYQYAPFSPNSKVVSVNAEDQYKISEDLPTIDGAYALYPIYAGVVQALYPREKVNWKTLTANGSDVTFSKLLDQEIDMIFSAPPSKQQLEDAKQADLSYEITPFAREAFVFFVHRDNPLDNLTSEQIRQIYAGKITHWQEILPGMTGEIKPFQRNEGSGSQTMLQKIMGDTPIMPPIMEDRLGGMGGIINDVASYRNYREALGFSFRFFATEMFQNGNIKLISIDGIPPTPENIANNTYPFLADACVITVRPRNENMQKIIDFLYSPSGVELIRKTGYVPYSQESTSVNSVKPGK